MQSIVRVQHGSNMRCVAGAMLEALTRRRWSSANHTCWASELQRTGIAAFQTSAKVLNICQDVPRDGNSTHEDGLQSIRLGFLA